jgi:hypothetical protein
MPVIGAPAPKSKDAKAAGTGESGAGAGVGGSTEDFSVEERKLLKQGYTAEQIKDARSYLADRKSAAGYDDENEED